MIAEAGLAALWLAAALSLGALVASSRVHVKIHHSSDVIGGALVGLAVGQVAKRIWKVR